MTTNIYEILDRIINSTYGRDVRQALYDGIMQTYNDMSLDGNANMEVTMARGNFDVLVSRLNDVDERILSKASGAPKGVYDTLSALQTAKPTGDTNIYLVTADGKWYYWNGLGAWTAGGIYQATGLQDSSVTSEKMADNSVTYKKLNKDVSEFVGEKVVFTSGGADKNAALQYTYNTTGKTVINQPITFSFDIYTKDPNVKSIQIRIFGYSSPNGNGTRIGSDSAATDLIQDKITSVTHTVTSTVHYDYIHAFIYVVLYDDTKKGEYYYGKETFTLNGSGTLSPHLIRPYQGSCVRKPVDRLPHQLVSQKTADVINDKPISVDKFNGYRVLAKANGSVEPQIQVGIAFDISSIMNSITVNQDSFVFSATIESESDKIKEIYTQFRISNVNVVGSTSGVVIGRSGKMLYSKGKNEYSRTAFFNAIDKYVHVFVDVWLTEEVTEPVEFFINNFKMVAKGVELPKLKGANLYDENVGEVAEYVRNRGEEVITTDRVYSKPFNGYKINAIENSRDVRLIQLGLVWDINAVKSSIVPGTSTFNLQADVQEEGTNKIFGITTQYRFTDNPNPAQAGNMDGTSAISINQSSIVTPFVDDVTHLDLTYTILDNVQPYFKAFIDINLNDDVIDPLDIYINNLKVTYGGVELPDPVQFGLYSKTANDTVSYISHKGDQLLTHDDIKGATIPNPLYNLKWNALGDSITGTTTFTSKFYHQYIAEKYGMQLVRNYGIGGTKIYGAFVDDTDRMSYRYTLMDDDADIITVFGGTNDCGGNAPIGLMTDRVSTTFYGACHILISGLIDKYPNKKIGMILPLQSSKDNRINTLINYVNVLREVCEYYGIPYLDMHREGGISSRNQVQIDAIMPDGLHPNTEGHRLIAEKIGAFMLSL